MYKYDKTPRFIVVNTINGEITGEVAQSKIVVGLKGLLKFK
jgi:hypothetical protein